MTSSSSSTPRGVTIVIPVYGHPPSLVACLQSVLEFAEEPWIDLLLVNDCGPEADEIETLILGMISNRARARYERNPRNLGFVQTCNRAVSELDRTTNDILLLNSDAAITMGAVEELRSVLALDERHGVVSPRSNNATIATIPCYPRDRSTPSRARSAEVFSAISPLLPRYYVSPVAAGFCLLIRRALIVNHGLFDPAFGAGYNEENDLCMRLNEVGYSSLIANRALVFHTGSSSFGVDRRAALEAQNAATLDRRFPFYREAVAQFVRDGFATADRFAELLVPSARLKRSVLIDLHHLPEIHDGTSKNVLSILDRIAALRDSDDDELDIAIAAYPETAEFFDLARYRFRILDYREIDEAFDLGISPVAVTTYAQLITLNRHCARWAVSHLDVIALRTLRLATQTPMKATIVTGALTWADRVLTISQSSLDDVAALYPGRLDDLADRSLILTQGSGLGTGTETGRSSERSVLAPLVEATIERGDYALVVGNGFPHKQVALALEALRRGAIDVIAMGDPALQLAYPDVAVVVSGTLSESALERLYLGASVVVYPSAYEGFGLPLAESAQLGKRLVVFDTRTSREVTERLGITNAHFFDRFDELDAAVRASLTEHAPPPPHRMRSLRDYGTDFWAAARALLEEPIDYERLVARDVDIGRLSGIAEGAMQLAERMLQQNSEIVASRSFRLARRIARVSGLVRALFNRTRPPSSGVRINRAIINQS